ncbi:alpha-L-glutamate ligase, RimK family [Shewanella pealeana ATCC 700345]|uniref:Probable alpha-L-glutamate ligase n=1 Tax=Shewanella pealeana (strain ATCC 700345 / ANG-SQ1) TaxID=398579 RepID=RIMK_SHEPA|nr:RecName: Full=Probable alpha-L-glutamate ligase [Shewanella pealeana ATCC 700345]ABV87421.1 alpha-L-glutamate ligase, RimK family [Shewanella pealeana ATCC 700345]
MSDNKFIIGSEEWCAFPALGVPAIKARVDSGARTSSIHAVNIRPFKREGEPWVSFELHPIQNSRKIILRCESKVVDRRNIKSSNGESEKRYVIASVIQLGGNAWEVELTLTNRDSMGYRMLLGREAMSNKTLVDPSESFCLGEKGDLEVEQLYGVKTAKKSGLKIGLLASNPDLYSNRRIIEAGEQRGHEMVFLNISQCYLKLDASSPEVHYRGGRVLNNVDAVIPRIRPSMTFYGCALTRHFESLNIEALNTSDAITRSRDKLFSLQLLQKNNLDIPTSGFANSPVDTKDLIDMVGGAPLIVKLLEGTQGKGVVLAETTKAAESVINAFKSLRVNLLVQEFIKEAQGKDLRCFVIDGKIVASIERTAAPGEFRANIHMGGSASIVSVSAAEKQLAIKAAKTMGLRVAGVDIIRSSRGPLLLEINSSPGLEGIESATGIDIAGAMIESIEKKLGWKAD